MVRFYFKNRKLVNSQVNWFIKIKVNAKVFFFTSTVSVTDQFWLISHRVTDWFWLISFNDNYSFFFFITAIFVVNSNVFVIIKTINKVFDFLKRLLFQRRKFKQPLFSIPSDGIGDGRCLVDITQPFTKPPSVLIK